MPGTVVQGTTPPEQTLGGGVAVSLGNITILGLPGFGIFPSFGLFTPTNPVASAYTPMGVNPFTGDALASQSLALQQIANNGLATIQAAGVGEFNALASWFSQWGASQSAFMTTAGDSLSIVARNSAKACSGFFTCLFG